MKTIRKPKKITVKFFLNRLLEPVVQEQKQAYHPLYIQVTYNRKNMQFKSMYGEYYKDESELPQRLMDFEERVIHQIINHETAQTESDYELKGLKRKFEVYSTSIGYMLERYLKPKLRAAIMKTNDELTTVLAFDTAHATVARLFKAAHLLFKDFDSYLTVKLSEELNALWNYQKLYPAPKFDYSFPTVIDWVDGSYRIELEKKLKDVYKNKPEVIRKVMTLVEQAVADHLKQLGI
jgi:hypothetical protein